MIRLPPRSTPLYSSAASDVYKRQDDADHAPVNDNRKANIAEDIAGRPPPPAGVRPDILNEARLAPTDDVHDVLRQFPVEADLDCSKHAPRDAVGSVEVHTLIEVYAQDGHRAGRYRLGDEIHRSLDSFSRRRFQQYPFQFIGPDKCGIVHTLINCSCSQSDCNNQICPKSPSAIDMSLPVSYTHLRAHETRHDLVCRLLL